MLLKAVRGRGEDNYSFDAVYLEPVDVHALRYTVISCLETVSTPPADLVLRLTRSASLTAFPLRSGRNFVATYLKKKSATAEAGRPDVRRIVDDILEEIRKRGEDAVRELALKYDSWSSDFVLSRNEIDTLVGQVAGSVRDDIPFAHRQVYGFAVKQRESMQDFETQIHPGVTLGQRHVPVRCAGCYVPGGRFAHAASAIMSVATAKAAGVPKIVACTPPRDESINPAVAYALEISGADVIMPLGGVQAIAAMAFGLFSGVPADIVVGPGNAFVSEAKRALFGEVGIDVLAGPTECLIIADRTADSTIVAVDLVSQAEHGSDSPVWLLTDSQELAEEVMSEVPGLIADLPNADAAETAWRDLAEVVVCNGREEMVAIADRYAAEHVQIIAEDLDWYVANLSCYGSLFLGESCTVAYGDKTTGTNHILPTGRAARYSGGLNVGKFIKTLTYQRVSREANRVIGAVASRISRLEGMEGHARAADIRLRKYFPTETFDFPVYDHGNRR